MKKLVSVILSMILLSGCLSCVTALAAGEDSFGAYEHVFIIGVDGVGAAFEKVETPAFDRIFADGAYRHNARTEYITVSAQNWGSILTGVAYDVHGLTNDMCSVTPRYSSDANNTVFRYVRDKYPESELVSFNNWNAINVGIIESDIGVNKIHAASDAEVTESIVQYIEEGNRPTLMFVQLDEADGAAHSYGGFSQEYYSKLTEEDTYIGRIYDTLVKYGLMSKGLFIVVSDHGETHSGHGGTTVEESSAVVAVAGKSVNNVILNENLRNRDVAAITLYALGVEQAQHMTAVVPQELFGEWKENEAFEGEDICDYCGKLHEGFFGFFIRLVHMIFALFV